MKNFFSLLAVCVIIRPAAAGPLEDLAKPMEGRSMRATSTMRQGEVRRMGQEILRPDAPPRGDTNEMSNWDNFYVAPGKTHVLLDEQGPGVINHIWMTFLGPEKQNWATNGSANHQELLLRIYWDGNERPGVAAPVGDFFASCFGQRHEVISMPVVVTDGSAYNCFWPMPFRKSARVEITNQSKKPLSMLYYNIDWVKKNSLPDDTPYFYAQYRQEYPAGHGKDYLILDTKGRGHYVGTVLAVRTRSPEWFGEGDEKIYIDGETTPSIWGTGTEDYFLMAWGLHPCNTPYFGCPWTDQWGIIGCHAEAYRWHINDPIIFNTGIRVTIEHWGWMSPDENADYKEMSWNEREDDYASVAFWYQTGLPTGDYAIPDAAQRQLPSLERLVVPATNFAAVQFHGRGLALPQQLDLYEDPQLFFRPSSSEEGWLEMHFTVTNKEPVRLLLNTTKAPDYGIYQMTLDGVKLGGPVDFYDPKIVSEECQLLDFWPEPGQYTLRMQCIGKNSASTGYFCGVESLRLRARRPRVTAMGHDKDKDWRKDPKLYND
jgi:hypothetical protein